MLFRHRLLQAIRPLFDKSTSTISRKRSFQRHHAGPSRRFESLESRWALDATLSFQMDVEAIETDGMAVVWVTLEGATDDVSVAYSTQDGTAIATSDYESASGVLNFDLGETCLPIFINILEDSVADDGETFQVRLSDAINATIDDDVALVTIDNRSPPIISGFGGVQNADETWTLSGTVTDYDGEVEGLTVYFGGIIEGLNATATVQRDGTFSITIPEPAEDRGTVTAQTVDTDGLESEIVMIFMT